MKNSMLVDSAQGGLIFDLDEDLEIEGKESVYRHLKRVAKITLENMECSEVQQERVEKIATAFGSSCEELTLSFDGPTNH